MLVAPRAGTSTAEFIFLLLAEGAEPGRSSDGAAGADLLGVQRPMEPSAEAERMRLEGVCAARESMGRVWPYSARVGVSLP
jgi:hypothetical protein